MEKWEVCIMTNKRETRIILLAGALIGLLLPVVPWAISNMGFYHCFPDTAGA